MRSQDMSRRRGFKSQVPEEDFQAGPDGLKFYDVTPGKGALPRKGDRVSVHYEIRWHGVTFMTSRLVSVFLFTPSSTLASKALTFH